MATPLETYRQQYDSSQERQNALKWQNATINDVASKYGFRFDKDYANQQAETVAAGQRNLYNNQSRQNTSLNQQTIRDIQSGLKEGIVGTEDNFFQQYLQQRQNQANRGINAGMQMDQDTRLGMNQQKVMAGLYRDANNAKSKEMDRFNNETQRISEALAQVEREKMSSAEKMYQELLSQGYGLLGQERGWYNTLDQQRYGQYQDMIDNWYREQDLALKKQEAARQRAAQQAAQQAALKAAQESALAKQLASYNATKAKQSQSALDKYYSSPIIQTVEQRKQTNPYLYKDFGAPLPPAQNPKLSAWDKMKMLGL